MPNREYVLLMARYNIWQNDNFLAASSALGEDSRKQDRGTFFNSVERTFSHLYWSDMMWLSRFADTAAPSPGFSDSANMITNWDDFRADRGQLDQRILQWAKQVSPDWLSGNLDWVSAQDGSRQSHPASLLAVHFFNHQTHHRGQIHAMLTAAGADPGLTDLAFMPRDYRDI